MKKAYLVLLMITMTAALFAGTPFENDLKTYDPYIADMNFGFDSLFVNPAGAAGNTGFVASVEAGTFGNYGSYTKIKEAIDVYNAIYDQSISPSDAVTAYNFITQNLSESDFDNLMAGTSLGGAGGSVATLSLLDLSTLTPTEVAQIAANIENLGYGAELLDVQFDVAVEAKTGFLIKGWGGGLYFRESMPFSAGAAGFTNMVGEAGFIAGGGFKLGPIHLGAVGHFGILTRHDNMTIKEATNNFWNESMVYGYTWGVNVGASLKLGAFSMGVVIRDIIGSTPTNLTYTTSWANLSTDMKNNPINWSYEFSMDMDFGITLEPDWKGFSPKFSLDYYNIIQLFRDIANGAYSNKSAQYIARDVIGNMRLGINVELIDMIKLGFQYYNNFFSIGAGIDLWVVEIQAEFIVDDSWMYGDVNNYSLNDTAKVGANLLVKVYLGDPKRQNRKDRKK